MRVSQRCNGSNGRTFGKCLSTIQSYNLDYEEIGIFGSYARGDYKSTSDIDFCIIVKERPSHYISIYIIRNVWLQPAG